MTREYLHSRLQTIDGQLYWRTKPETDTYDRDWNNRYAAKRAGNDKHVTIDAKKTNRDTILAIMGEPPK